jgi:hypothetical protein
MMARAAEVPSFVVSPRTINNEVDEFLYVTDCGQVFVTGS